jgi:hypothetical protein
MPEDLSDLINHRAKTRVHDHLTEATAHTRRATVTITRRRKTSDSPNGQTVELNMSAWAMVDAELAMAIDELGAAQVLDRQMMHALTFPEVTS